MTRAIAREPEESMSENEVRLAGTDWRRCEDCGVDWPHPSCTSSMRCPTCQVDAAIQNMADKIAKLQAEVERLRHKKCVHDLAKEYTQNLTPLLEDEELQSDPDDYPLY